MRALIVAAVMVLSGAGTAHAQNVNGQGTDLLVTVAARSCPSYEDITANLARNDIQESLRDLGADTLYTSGEPINPAKEDEGQPNCTPLRDWQFTFGRGIGGTVKGTWGSLSYVSSPDSPTVVTKPNTPAMDENGRPVQGGAIAGAVTVELSQEQADAAASHNLWIQGGTVDDPVLDKVYPGTYGFGALRCAVDNLNGDNVEFVQIPSGSRHVFCYAYYVVPPPSAGTIVIRKTVKGAPDADESFVMAGNISYDPSGTFTLAGGESQTFFRAETRPGEAPWTVTERVPDGWALTRLRCTHPGASVVTTNRATGKADITLADGDTVTCTYTNRLRPTDGLLLLRKISLGGVGTFPLTASGDGGFSRAREIKTTIPGVAKASKPIKASPGSYRVSEDLPRGWRLEKVVCNGRTGATATVTRARGAVCTVTNRKRQIGRLVVRQVSQGGTGTAGFAITQLQPLSLEPPRRYQKQARTRAENRAREATGDRTTGIPFGAYVINQSLIASDEPGTWALVERRVRRAPPAVRAGPRDRAGHAREPAGQVHVHEPAGVGRPGPAAAAGASGRAGDRGAEPGRDQGGEPVAGAGRRHRELRPRGPQRRRRHRPAGVPRRSAGEWRPDPLGVAEPGLVPCAQQPGDLPARDARARRPRRAFASGCG